MSTVAKAYPVLPRLGVALGATTPSAAAGARIWSTTALRVLVYQSGAWVAEESIGVSGVAAATADPYPIQPHWSGTRLGAVTARAAREDHQHVLPLAGGSVAWGSLGADDLQNYTRVGLGTHLTVTRQQHVGEADYVAGQFYPNEAIDSLVSMDVAGRAMPFVVPAPLDGANLGRYAPYALQTADYQSRQHSWEALEPGSTVPYTWAFFPMVAGVAAARVLSGGSPSSTGCRIGYQTAAGAGAFAGLYTGDKLALMRQAVSTGGPAWFMCARLNPVAVSAGHRFFFGVRAQSGMPTGNPSTNAQISGFGCDSGDTQAFWIESGSKTALPGLSAWRTMLNDVCDFYIGQPRNSNQVHYAIRRVAPASASADPWLASGSLQAGWSATFLPVLWWSNGTVASVDAWDIHHLYLETEY